MEIRRACSADQLTTLIAFLMSEANSLEHINEVNRMSLDRQIVHHPNQLEHGKIASLVYAKENGKAGTYRVKVVVADELTHRKSRDHRGLYVPSTKFIEQLLACFHGKTQKAKFVAPSLASVADYREHPDPD